MSHEDNVKVLHWLPEERRWEEVGWELWSRFRGIGDRSEGMPGVRGGIHYFIVCIHDDGVAVNLIPHKYMLEPDGSIGAALFGGLTREERADYSRIMVLLEHTEEDSARLAAIHDKLGRVYYPPNESIDPLKQALAKAPLKGSLAEQFLESYAAS